MLITLQEYSQLIKKQILATMRYLQKLNDKYDCPVVVNTSFNIRGEPIVCTPKDAYMCFMRTEMDCLIMGNYLLEKTKQKPLVEILTGKVNLNWIKKC